MSLESILFSIGARRNDRRRDSAIPFPQGLTCHRDLSYGKHGRHNLLDVYYPQGTKEPLATIVSIHGGGFVYGDKELYSRYCMDLARRGFAVVNFNYRLAPRWRFPAPMEDTNAVMEWICANAEAYYLDPARLFVVGDSAGAQMASQYAAIWGNPDYAKLFGLIVPGIQIRAVGLNCGLYDPKSWVGDRRKGLERDYLGKIAADDPRLDVLGQIGCNYPPAHITTAYYDFLRENAQPMCDLLRSRGVHAVCQCYGGEDRKDIGHVFHVNIILPEAIACNDSQTDFFRQQIGENDE